MFIFERLETAVSGALSLVLLIQFSTISPNEERVFLGSNFLCLLFLGKGGGVILFINNSFNVVNLLLSDVEHIVSTTRCTQTL